jgi:flagellar hook-associated protein 3 FlgL
VGLRVTFNGQFRDATTNIERASDRLLEFQRQVSSGRRLDRVSDDPSSASSALGERTKIAQVDQFTRSTESAYSRLSVVDTVLSDIVSKLTAAQVAATSALGTTPTAAQRTAAAQQLDGLKAALLDDFNTSLQGNYLFAGTKSTTKPYVVGGGGTVAAYAGSSTEVQVDVDQDRIVTVAFDGSAITQGTDATDVFATIDALITAVNAGDSDAINTGIATLGNVFGRVTAAQSRVGSAMQTLDAEKLRLSATKLASSERLSKLEDANMAEAITGMQQADTAYKAALGAAATASKVSLMDYL